MQKDDFANFVKTFGIDHAGTKSAANYAKLCGIDRSTVSRYINGVEKVPKIHEFIKRLVDDRQAAKDELRQLKRAKNAI